jgi:hypothetical protein
MRANRVLLWTVTCGVAGFLLGAKSSIVGYENAISGTVLGILIGFVVAALFSLVARGGRSR